MNADRFTVLQAEFETASSRLRESHDFEERQALLREIRQIIARMDSCVSEMRPKSDLLIER